MTLTGRPPALQTYGEWSFTPCLVWTMPNNTMLSSSIAFCKLPQYRLATDIWSTPHYCTTMSDKPSVEDNTTKIPSEYRISEKWDKCIENFTLHFSAGLVAGGLTSLVLARMCLRYGSHRVNRLTICLVCVLMDRYGRGTRCVDRLWCRGRSRFQLDNMSIGI